jgi:hypothetical protein
MKFSNIVKYGIYGLLILSIWGIFSIGIGIIPLINIPKIPADFCLKLNDVYLNLSYSYIIGFVIYTLTVLLPEYKRKEKYLPLIENIVNDTYSKFLHNYYMFAVGNDDLKLNSDEEISMKNIRQTLDEKYTHSTLEFITKKIDYKNRGAMIKGFQDYYEIFIKEMIPIENFLSAEQVQIFNQIRQSKTLEHLESEYLLLKEHRPDKNIDSKVFKTLNEHIYLLERLKNDL